MKKWEYKIIETRALGLNSFGDVEQCLNLIGDEGWEIISVDSSDPVDRLDLACVAKCEAPESEAPESEVGAV